MGRPPRADRGSVQSVTLSIRLTASEAAQLAELVAASGMSTAAYVRGLIVREVASRAT